MEKNHRSLIMFLLLSSLLITDIYAGNALKKGFWQTVGAAAVAVVAGVGAYKLLDWCFSETNSQLVARAEQEYAYALQFVDSIVLLEGAYNLNRIIVRETFPPQYVFYPVTSLDRRVVFGRVYEPVLYSLARALFDRGIICATYIHDISGSKDRLSELSKKLHIRIEEQKGVYLHHQDAQLLSMMYSLVNRIDEYLSHVSLFADFMEHHKNYYMLFDTEGYLQKQYDVELRIVTMGSSYCMMMHDLRESVAWRYADKKYPFLSFVSQIEYDISSLRSYVRSLSHSYTERMRYATWLLESLEWIKKAIASDERYTHQKYQAEQERLERLRLEAELEKIRIQEAQLYEQRKQNRLLAENNMLQEQQLVHNVLNTNQSCPVTFIIQ